MAPCSLFANGQNRISEREDSLNSVKERGSHGALRSQLRQSPRAGPQPSTFLTVVPGPVFRGLLSRGRVCALRPWLFPLCSKLLPGGLDYLLRRADIDQSDTEAD